MKINPRDAKGRFTKKSTFKVGDKVVCLYSDYWSKKGWEGSITRIDNIVFVSWNNGQNWSVTLDQIKLLSEPKKEKEVYIVAVKGEYSSIKEASGNQLLNVEGFYVYKVSKKYKVVQSTKIQEIDL